MAFYRIEIYRPHPDNPDSLSRERTLRREGQEPQIEQLLRQHPWLYTHEAFALVILVQGPWSRHTEQVVQRWRADRGERLFRADATGAEVEVQHAPVDLALSGQLQTG
jgi:hypothetical protein